MEKSVSSKFWRKKSVNEGRVREFTQRLGITDILAKLLAERIDSLEAADDFIVPKLKNMLPDPLHLLDMDKAISRVIRAINSKQKICIFGDYDVDGATSSALLKRLFSDLKVETEIYVPDRITEGYGPNPVAMQKIADLGARLVITVDCGSMSHDSIDFANSLGMDIIVIDHHTTIDILPNAVAVINPNRLDDQSSYGYLAAVGVTFLFSIALTTELKAMNYFKKHNLALPDLLQYLDLVALGTVCDVMPLTGLNRAFVSQGLKIMGQRKNKGIKSLLDNCLVQEKPNCYHLGFILGPRINAGGRVGLSYLGAHLLSSTCEVESRAIATKLEEYNNERKTIELSMLEKALSIAEAKKDKNFLFIAGEKWHPGVIGIIAGQLKEKFNKPIAVVAVNEGIGKASCRSIRGIDFGNKIFEAKQLDLVINGGGHAMAAGFTALEEKLTALEDALDSMFAKDFANRPEEIFEYSENLTPDALSLELLNEINKLEPYGNHNPEPVFKIDNLYVLKADLLKDKHIKCLLMPNRDNTASKAISAIAFNAANTRIHDILLSAHSYNFSIICTLKVNSWQGRETVQVQLKDIIL